MPRLIAVLALALVAACSRAPGEHAHAKALIASQCAACHTVPGVTSAHGNVGPSLTGFAQRAIIAGRLPNTPANLRAFLLHPQKVQPGGAMPEMGLTPDQTAAIADYLYTLDTP